MKNLMSKDVEGSTSGSVAGWAALANIPKCFVSNWKGSRVKGPRVQKLKVQGQIIKEVKKPRGKGGEGHYRLVHPVHWAEHSASG